MRVGISQSFISKLHSSLSRGLPHAEPVPSLRTDETYLVRSILQMLQGFASSLFYWDKTGECFLVKNGIFVSHLSKTSLKSILDQFMYAGTCLKQIELFVKTVKASHQRAPTLDAFGDSVYLWLKRLQDQALAEEMKLCRLDTRESITLLGLTNSLLSLCSGAEYLFQVVAEAVPNSYFQSEASLPSCEIAVHILDYLYKKLDEVCLVQGGQVAEEAYHMTLTIFAASLLPYLEGLDSWLYQGILDDPYEEMFFYADDSVSVDQTTFWDKSYLMRMGKLSKLIAANEYDVKFGKEDNTNNIFRNPGREIHPKDSSSLICPFFLKDMAGAIVSSGKSLQLIRHLHYDSSSAPHFCVDSELPDSIKAKYSLSDGEFCKKQREDMLESLECHRFKIQVDLTARHNVGSAFNYSEISRDELARPLTLSELFLVSLSGLLHSDLHQQECVTLVSTRTPRVCTAIATKQHMVNGTRADGPLFMPVESPLCGEISQEHYSDVGIMNSTSDEIENNVNIVHVPNGRKVLPNAAACFCAANPVTSVSRKMLESNVAYWNDLNVSRYFYLPPLNDEQLRDAIYGKREAAANIDSKIQMNKDFPGHGGTSYAFGFQFTGLEHLRLEEDLEKLEKMCPFPAVLPWFQENVLISELLPFQKNSTLTSRVLNSFRETNPKETYLPTIIFEQCLAVYTKSQVEAVGDHMLLKLMNEWKLMDELGVLRSIYLLGSGDLLQQFLDVIFDKLDKGDRLDDDFELNNLLQESIRNSCDGAMLNGSDSLVVSVMNDSTSEYGENFSGHIPASSKDQSHSFGIDSLDSLHFTYKVSWPLNLIANMEALKKYNQVMSFLLKVKRAKYALDKARRWMWKGGGQVSKNFKHHLLVEQKLHHFVNAFHQYVMDRVFHSAWVDLCTEMACAGSLDKVIEVHEVYLLSVQRQCFVAPDKAGALIANRVRNIVALALDFYSIQQTLNGAAAAPAIKARCEMEVDRIEKQFDDCIAFLLRILSFKLNVGQFPHLADLVIRINYNYFYMSENGNLKTVPTFENTAGLKVGKTSIIRTD